MAESSPSPPPSPRAGPPSRIRPHELADCASLLSHLSRAHTQDIRAGLLSTRARPQSAKSSASIPARSTLAPVLQSTDFTLFPLLPSTLPTRTLFTLPEELLVLADQQLRAVAVASPPTSEAEPLDAPPRPPPSLHPSHRAPLVLSAVQLLDGTLSKLAEQTLPTTWKNLAPERKRKRAKEKGWESVLKALYATSTTDAGVKERTRARLEELFGPCNIDLPTAPSVVPSDAASILPDDADVREAARLPYPLRKRTKKRKQVKPAGVKDGGERATKETQKGMYEKDQSDKGVDDKGDDDDQGDEEMGDDGDTD